MTKQPRAPGTSRSRATTVVLLGIIVLLSAALVAALLRSPAGDARPPAAATADAALQPPADITAAPRAERRQDSGGESPAAAAPAARYTRLVADYRLPDVTLIDASGSPVALRDALDHDGPLMMQFVFTTCPTICPVMSATFAAAQEKLDDRAPHARLVSISIDPEHDTPAQLREYARRFNAGPQWQFLTGTRDNIAAVQKAFQAYQDNKMRHAPLTFLRAARERPWVRIDGLPSAGELLAELARPADGAAPATDGLAAATTDDQSAACAACLAPSTAAAEGTAATGDARLGERIYHEGILPSGQPLRATTLGDVVVEGTHVNCASCHRPSGFAGGEETIYVPAITGPVLYRQRELDRGDLFRKLFQDTRPKPSVARVRSPCYRPAYTDQTLAAAIRHGSDPAGRQFDPLMPRYELSDEDMGHLIAYLKSLFAAPTPGVTASQIHFATVVTPDVDAGQRRAMLDVIEAYVRRKNADTEGKRRRPGFSPLYKDEFEGAFRTWNWQPWELTGPPASWPAQLEAYYRQQPVFALLSGLGREAWQPVHDFCERREVPCLFPNLDLPVVDERGRYCLYFSRGLTVESEALAQHLAEQADLPEGARVVQVYRDRPRGRVPSAALRVALANTPLAAPQQRMVPAGQPLDAAFWRQLLVEQQPSVLVLWLGGEDLAELSALSEQAAGLQQVYLSRSLVDELPGSLPAELLDKLYLTSQFAESQQQTPRIYRVRSWMRSRNIRLTHEPLQLNTYFALSIVDHALVHLVENFSRDYLIESIEHETENGLNPGVFPHLSLGPGQRFASKGSYIVRPAPTASGHFQAISPWIIP